MSKGFKGSLSDGKNADSEEKKYMRLWVKRSTEENIKKIRREIAYKEKRDYPFWEIMEDALNLLAKEKNIQLK